MKGREDFVRRWRSRLAGLALCGLVSELRDSPMERGSKALDIPKQVDDLLARMFDDAIEQDKNGAADAKINNPRKP